MSFIRKGYGNVISSLIFGIFEVGIPLATYLESNSLVVTALFYTLYKLGIFISYRFEDISEKFLLILLSLIAIKTVIFMDWPFPNLNNYLMGLGVLSIGFVYSRFSIRIDSLPKPLWWKGNFGMYLMVIGMVVGTVGNLSVLFMITMFLIMVQIIYRNEFCMEFDKEANLICSKCNSPLWLCIFAFFHQFQYQMFSFLIVIKLYEGGLPYYVVGLAFCSGWILYIPGKYIGDLLLKYISIKGILIWSYLISIPWLILMTVHSTPEIIIISFLMHGLTISFSRVYRNLAHTPQQQTNLFILQRYAAFLGPLLSVGLLFLGKDAPFIGAAIVMAAMLFLVIGNKFRNLLQQRK
ncbi:hypothetical protein ACVCK3_18895 [Bacillus cereus]